MLTVKTLSEYVPTHFPDVQCIQSFGEISFFYNPNCERKRGSYFCTIKENDGPNDKASHLHRKNAYRFNFGISKKTFMQLFGSIPERPAKGAIIEGSRNFTELNALHPHPIYGWMCWVAILNPSQEMFVQLQPLLSEAYARAKNQK